MGDSAGRTFVVHDEMPNLHYLPIIVKRGDKKSGDDTKGNDNKRNDDRKKRNDDNYALLNIA